jgi:coproporphyrinogen III oxidase/oxygen-independent coproporphyrinogen-3 oxidase
MYVHIPFCANKCTYCRFTADYNPKDEKINSYLDYLLNKELELLSRTVDLKSRNLEAIYIGGGTPTFLSEKNLELLLSSIREKTNPNALIELEAHPNTLTDDKLRYLRTTKYQDLA